VLAIDVPAKDYTDYTSRGGLILLNGFISMILAVGAIFWFGSKRDDEEKNSGKKRKAGYSSHPQSFIFFPHPPE